MQCTLAPIPPLLNPLDPVRTRLHLTNDGAKPARFWDSLGINIWVEGHSVSTEAVHVVLDGAQAREITLAPGQTWSPDITITLDLQLFHGRSGQVTVPAMVDIALHAPGDDLPDHPTPEQFDALVTHLTLHTEMTLDFARVEWLMQANGAPSIFFRSEGAIFSHYRGSAPHSLKVAAPDKAYALTNMILDDGKKLYFASHSSRRRPAPDLSPLNAVFFRAGDRIMTEYGEAKVDDPASFEVLDPGVPSLHARDVFGYLCSYARDAQAGYFFCGSTSTTKAIKLRACKAPGTLVSLGYGFAKDDRHVYLEAKVIKTADPASFERINSLYWRDATGIGFLDRRVPEADPRSFAPVDYYYKGRLQDPAPVSDMGRDKDSVFQSGARRLPND